MISVLIPVYNNWELTRACLEALAASRDGQELEVIVVDNEEGGPKDLILERSGGGAEIEYVKLSCTDGVYTNVSDAEAVSGLESVQGVAVLCNDLADDMQTGNYLTLEGV